MLIVDTEPSFPLENEHIEPHPVPAPGWELMLVPELWRVTGGFKLILI